MNRRMLVQGDVDQGFVLLSSPWQRNRLRLKQPEDCSAMDRLSETCP